MRNAVILPSRRPERDESRAHKSAASSAALTSVCVVGASGSGAHLVEAVGAVHGPVVARKEGHERLSTALGTRGRVHLSLSPVAAPARDAQGSVLLGDGSAALASLRLVHQPLAGVELLFAP